MIENEGRIQNHLLILTNELDHFGDRYMEKVNPEERKGFKKDVDTLREELFHIINLNKKIKEIIERSYS
ncbi:hypothetical protein HQ529_02385 [Candidatus Woesearchaeota archaeon]|nr:hypothetical protein [Candidatus Woesearchaeota archaeon]